MPAKKGNHLTFDDRCEIEEMLKDGCSFREIARKLSVSPSTISSEVKRNRIILPPRTTQTPPVQQTRPAQPPHSAQDELPAQQLLVVPEPTKPQPTQLSFFELEEAVFAFDEIPAESSNQSNAERPINWRPADAEHPTNWSSPDAEHPANSLPPDNEHPANWPPSDAERPINWRATDQNPLDSWRASSSDLAARITKLQSHTSQNSHASSTSQSAHNTQNAQTSHDAPRGPGDAAQTSQDAPNAPGDTAQNPALDSTANACQNPAHNPTVNERQDPTTSDCPRRDRAPYVCNNCSQRRDCNLSKARYIASRAQDAYDNRLSQAHRGIACSMEELKPMVDKVKKLLAQGQSIQAIWATHGDEFPVCERTFYNYVERGVLGLTNLALVKKVRYAPRSKARERLRVGVNSNFQTSQMSQQSPKSNVQSTAFSALSFDQQSHAPLAEQLPTSLTTQPETPLATQPEAPLAEQPSTFHPDQPKTPFATQPETPLTVSSAPLAEQTLAPDAPQGEHPHASAIPTQTPTPTPAQTPTPTPTPTPTTTPQNPLVNRRYRDWLALPGPERFLTVQMDTVEGCRNNRQCILSLHFVRLFFQLYLLLDEKSQECVQSALDKVEYYCQGAFTKTFPVLLTDRGKEFADGEGIERGIYGTRRTRVFYCDPIKPFQKGAAEKNHVELRKILPKGTNFDELTPADVAEITSHVNSYPRAGLGTAPIHQAMRELPQSLTAYLGIREIAPDDVIMKPALLRHRR